jgi:hypothetical protein
MHQLLLSTMSCLQSSVMYICRYVYLSEANSGPFKTLDGIEEGGQRLFNEVLNLIERMRSLQKVMYTYISQNMRLQILQVLEFQSAICKAVQGLY